MTMSAGGAGPSRPSDRQSFIDRDSHFNGTYATPNDLHVEGRYEGEIDCQGTLVVAESADVNARVSAGGIMVAGRLQGEIACRGRFEILPSGRVAARVLAGSIAIHEGAQYEGELRMRGEETSELSTHVAGARPAPAPPRRRTPGFEAGEIVPPFPATGSCANGRLGEETAPQSPTERGSPGITGPNEGGRT